MPSTSNAGLFDGLDPTVYDPKNPIILFIIQAGLIVGLTRLIHLPLKLLHQPSVIAEVIAGILLGPTALGRIPGFTQHVFPTASMPALTLVANIGLVLFLFVVGLEVDLKLLKDNWPVAVSVAAIGMVIPFGLGAALAYGLYDQFQGEDATIKVSFGAYLLFIGVAMAITAFPVLCRILTALKLLKTTVGIIVLSAGGINDVAGWILLAVSVALINSGAGITALWILLVAVAYCLFVAFLLRPAFHWFLRRSGSLEEGPTQTVIAITLMIVFASAFFTQVIGIHQIFGAFIIGLICPKGAFAIKVTEKIEDFVAVIFLPLYFALSGLNTNIGLLDTGIVWGYLVGCIAIALIGKIAGGALAARLYGFVWRESFSIGVLMSCKGLVELIVLNIGLQAKILSQRTFTIFVVMALVTTVTTTPLIVWLYPAAYQEKLRLWRAGKIDWNGNRLESGRDSQDTEDAHMPERHTAQSVLVNLRLDALPSIFTIIQLFGKSEAALATSVAGMAAMSVHKLDSDTNQSYALEPDLPVSAIRPSTRLLQLHGLHLQELTDRESSVMKVYDAKVFASQDPVIQAFDTFSQSQNVAATSLADIVPTHSFSSALLARAAQLRSDLVLLPWSDTGTMSEYAPLLDRSQVDPWKNTDFALFVADVCRKAAHKFPVAVFLDQSILSRAALEIPHTAGASLDMVRFPSRAESVGPSWGQSSQILRTKSRGLEGYLFVVPFLGSEDDLYAVRLALRLANDDSTELRILDLCSHSAARSDSPRVSQDGSSANADDQAAVSSAISGFRNATSSLTRGISSDSRISLLELSPSVSPLDCVIDTVSATGSTKKTIVFVGRNVGVDDETMRSSYTKEAGEHANREALGKLGLDLARTARTSSPPMGLLVVNSSPHKHDRRPPFERVTSVHVADKMV